MASGLTQFYLARILRADFLAHFLSVPRYWDESDGGTSSVDDARDLHLCLHAVETNNSVEHARGRRGTFVDSWAIVIPKHSETGCSVRSTLLVNVMRSRAVC